MRVLSIWFAEISCQGRSRNLATWRQSEGCNIQAAQTQLRAKTTKEIVKGRENATTWSSSSISQCNHHLKVPCSRITSIGALSFRTSADVAKLPHNIGDSETLFLVSFVSTCFFVFLSSKNMVTFPMTTYQPKKTCLHFTTRCFRVISNSFGTCPPQSRNAVLSLAILAAWLVPTNAQCVSDSLQMPAWLTATYSKQRFSEKIAGQ